MIVTEVDLAFLLFCGLLLVFMGCLATLLVIDQKKGLNLGRCLLVLVMLLSALGMFFLLES